MLLNKRSQINSTNQFVYYYNLANLTFEIKQTFGLLLMNTNCINAFMCLS